MIQLVLFDFDGTLVDSIEPIYESIKKEVEANCCPLSSKFKDDLGDWPLREHLRRAGIRKNRETIVKRVKKDLWDERDTIKPAPYLQTLQTIPVEKAILSNNSKHFIEGWLRKNKIRFFTEVHSPREFHNKTEGIRKVLRKKKLRPSEVMYVGDRDRDMFAAKKAGCVSVATHNNISWSSKQEILDSQPDFIISNLRQLRGIINTLNKKGA